MAGIRALFQNRMKQVGSALMYGCLILTFFVTIAGCSEEKAANPAVPEELTITIQGGAGEKTTFRVLKSYLTPGLNVVDGSGTTIVMEAMWPNMTPARPMLEKYRQSKDPQLEKEILDNIIHINIKRGWNYTSKKIRNSTVYPPEAPRDLPVVNDLYSLGRVTSPNPRARFPWAGRRFAYLEGKLSETPIPGGEYYVPVSEQYDTAFYYCIFPEVSKAGKCELTKDVNRDVFVKVIFPRRLMDNWQQVDAQATQFVLSLVSE